MGDRLTSLWETIKEKAASYTPNRRIDHAAVKRLLDEGKGVAEIAQMLGCEKNNVEYVRTKYRNLASG